MAIPSLIRPLGAFLLVGLLFCGQSFAEENAPAPAEPYQIGPEDVLNLFVWKEPELSMEVRVLPDGRISFPLVGEVEAAGLSVGELRAIMTEKLEKFVEAPEVTVIVKEALSRRIYTIGEVNKPGPYPLAPSMTVLQALSVAGGFAEWADKEDILVIRRQGGEEVRMPFDYPAFLSGKDPQQNILLEPNDTVVVP